MSDSTQSTAAKWLPRILWAATWLPIIAGCVLAGLDKVVALAGQHWPIPGWYGQALALGGGAVKFLRIVGPKAFAALTGMASQGPKVTWESIILAVILSFSGVAVPEIPAMPGPAAPPSGDFGQVSDVADVPGSVLEVIEVIEAAPDSTWDAPAEQDAGEVFLDTFPGIEAGRPEAAAPMDNPLVMGVEMRPVAIEVGCAPVAIGVTFRPVAAGMLTRPVAMFFGRPVATIVSNHPTAGDCYVDCCGNVTCPDSQPRKGKSEPLCMCV